MINLEPDYSVRNIGKVLRLKTAICSGGQISQIQHVVIARGIKPFADQLRLVLLECFGRFERVANPHENWMRERRQPLRQMFRQCF
jgi:hypothetical protein